MPALRPRQEELGLLRPNRPRGPRPTARQGQRARPEERGTPQEHRRSGQRANDRDPGMFPSGMKKTKARDHGIRTSAVTPLASTERADTAPTHLAAVEAGLHSTTARDHTGVPRLPPSPAELTSTVPGATTARPPTAPEDTRRIAVGARMAENCTIGTGTRPKSGGRVGHDPYETYIFIKPCIHIPVRDLCASVLAHADPSNPDLGTTRWARAHTKAS